MSNIEKKEKNLNQLIDKLNILSSTYSQSSYEIEKVKTEKNYILNQKLEIEKLKLVTKVMLDNQTILKFIYRNQSK